MKFDFNVTGITFTPDKAKLAQTRPAGPVELRHDPFVHPKDPALNDPQAIRVIWNGLRVGYVPKEGPARIELWDIHEKMGEFPPAFVKQYSYKDGKSFNNDHLGKLGSVTIQVGEEPVTKEAPKKQRFAISVMSGEKVAIDSVTHTEYVIGGKSFMRLSNVLDHFNSDPDNDAILRWACGFGSYEAYKAALAQTVVEGNALHDDYEKFQAKDCEIGELKIGMQNFINDFNLDGHECEVTLFDELTGVAGTFDVNGHVASKKAYGSAIIDWKRSKKVSESGHLKTCIYAAWMKSDCAITVGLGSPNVCGYQAKISHVDEITRAYAWFVGHVASIEKYKQIKG